MHALVGKEGDLVSILFQFRNFLMGDDGPQRYFAPELRKKGYRHRFSSSNPSGGGGAYGKGMVTHELMYQLLLPDQLELMEQMELFGLLLKKWGVEAVWYFDGPLDVDLGVRIFILFYFILFDLFDLFVYLFI